MYKIRRLIITLVWLFMVTAIYADGYTITYKGLPAGDNTYISASKTSGITEGTQITLTLTPPAGYYVEEILIEQVADLGQAETRVTTPNVGIQILSKNNNYSAHFGGNYTFSMPGNNVEITPKYLPCTELPTSFYLDAVDVTSKEYDANNHTLLVIDGATPLTRGIHYGADVYQFKNAGTYTPVVTGWGVYKGEKSGIQLTITQAPLTITAQDKEKIYGNDNPDLTVTYSGWKGNDKATDGNFTQPTISTVATTYSDVGTYTITPSGAASTNYSISYQTGTLTINPKPLSQNSGCVLVTLSPNSYDADENVHYPSVTSIADTDIDSSDGHYTLRSGTDYTVADVSTASAGVFGNTDHVQPDIYTVDITFAGNYSGTYKQPYQIRKKVTLNETWTTSCERNVNMETMPAASEADGFRAYTVSSFSNNSITLTERNYIKKDEPMLFYREKTQTDYYPPLAESVGSWTGTNLLKAAASNQTISDLKGGGDYSIWILVDGYFVRAKDGTLPAGKCYMKIANGSVSGTRVAIGYTSTDMGETVKEILNDSHWYTLDGRRLQGPPSRKGIYIVNGKKVVIK